MADGIDDVTVVGGGDLGLLTALSVRQMNPDLDVSVVDDFGQQIPQVGKSTYQEIQHILHGSLEIPEDRFIEAVKPVWKATVYFRDWCDFPAFHYPFDLPQKYPSDDTPNAFEYYYYLYDEVSRSDDHMTRCERIVEERQSPGYYGPTGDLTRYDDVAYHLNTERFNTFLRDLCRERDVGLIDDEITAVETTGDHVDAVRSKRQSYEADLYVDATGFNRVLRSEQDASFRDFGFPLDTAYNVRVDRSLSDVIPATIVETGDHGWFWHIDTYDNRDLGYVYASEYVDDEAALAEFLDHVADVAPDDADEPPVTEDEVSQYAFDSGYFQRAWVDNCLAIGNAEGFVEPLQSTGLTANASAAVTFANLLTGHGQIQDDHVRESYNTYVERVWESIYDFISVHYRYSDGDTAFWEDVSSLPVSDRVERVVEEFDRFGFDYNIDTATGSDLTEFEIFYPPDYFVLMRNMGATSAFYETNDFEVSDEVRRQEDERYQETRDAVANSHLSVRELYRGVLEF